MDQTGHAGGGITARLAGRVGAFNIDVAFDAPLKGVTALFGPSGSGKTTVLRCIAGLTRLDGRLTVGSQVWQDDKAGVFIPAHARPIGYVFQDARLFPHLDVRGNLLFGSKRVSNTSTAEAFDRLVALLGLDQLLGRSVANLSGGEQQRVSIGRALLTNPRLLLMDEPLSAVDRGVKDEVLPYLERLSDTFSVPILYVSHDISEVSRLADWMVLISRGAVSAQGPLDELLARLDLNPATGRFEAGVVVTARVTGRDAAYQLAELDLEGQTLSVPGLDSPVGSEVRLRIRARDVAIATSPPDGLSIRNVLRGRVASLVSEDTSAFAELLVAIGDARLRARITRQAVDQLDLKVGADVFALVKSVAFDSRATIKRPD